MAARTAWAGTATAEVFDIADANSLPGGWIGYVENTAGQSGIGGTITDITGLSQAVTLGTSRRIKVTVWLQGCLSTVGSADRAEAYIREGSTVLSNCRAYQPAATADDVGPIVIEWVGTPTSGSHTYKASFVRQAGTGTFTVRGNTDAPSFLLVEDIGPSA